MDLVIKIRWNCGTERYVTGFAGRDSVFWKPEEHAYAFQTMIQLLISCED